jgi:serine/threonine protein kinase
MKLTEKTLDEIKYLHLLKNAPNVVQVIEFYDKMQPERMLILVNDEYIQFELNSFLEKYKEALIESSK